MKGIETGAGRISRRSTNVIREPVAWFAEQMERKLAMHDEDRGADGWSVYCCEMEYLMARLEEESKELIESLYAYGSPLSIDQAEGVIEECADVANFAMMIADQARVNASAIRVKTP